jgi:hypothetical protein
MDNNNLKEIIKSSYLKNDEAEKIGNNLNYKLDRDLSNREHKVFLDKENKPIVAFTGTRKFGDVISDGLLAVGLQGLDPRFRESRKLVNNIRKKYNQPITTVGHSLGGSLAEYAGGNKVITVDKGVGIGGIGKKIKNNQTDIRSSNDLVSLLSLTQKSNHRITIPKTAQIIDPLKSHNFRNLSRLKRNTI